MLESRPGSGLLAAASGGRGDARRHHRAGGGRPRPGRGLRRPPVPARLARRRQRPDRPRHRRAAAPDGGGRLVGHPAHPRAPPAGATSCRWPPLLGFLDEVHYGAGLLGFELPRVGSVTVDGASSLLAVAQHVAETHWGSARWTWRRPRRWLAAVAAFVLARRRRAARAAAWLARSPPRRPPARGGHPGHRGRHPGPRSPGSGVLRLRRRVARVRRRRPPVPRGAAHPPARPGGDGLAAAAAALARRRRPASGPWAPERPGRPRRSSRAGAPPLDPAVLHAGVLDAGHRPCPPRRPGTRSRPPPRRTGCACRNPPPATGGSRGRRWPR